MLVLTAFTSVGLSVVIVLFGLNNERASISTVARTDSVAATVEHVDDTNDNIPLVWVELSDDFGPSDVDRLTQDHRGTTVTPCDRPSVQEDPDKRQRIITVAEARPSLVTERCLVFDTDETTSIDPGTDQIVRYDLDKGLAFLEIQMWSVGYVLGPVMYLFFMIAFLALSYHSVRAVRWRMSLILVAFRRPAVFPLEAEPG